MPKNIGIIIGLAMMCVVATWPQVSRASEATGTITAGTRPAGLPNSGTQPTAFTVTGPSQNNAINGASIFKGAVLIILAAEVITLIVIWVNKRRKILKG